MQYGTCYLVGAGDFTKRLFHPKEKDLVIAADGGYSSLKEYGIKPHFLVGDMDSIRHKVQGVPKLKFPVEKDDTDLSLALRLAVARGWTDFKLYGVSGSRPDHFYATLQLMADYAEKGFSIRAVLPQATVYAIHNGSLTLTIPVLGTVVSVFCPDGQADGVTFQGLRYPLTDAQLTAQTPLGVSNETKRHRIKISVRDGTLMVFVMNAYVR